MNQEKIGKFIAENRKSKGMTQAELAESIGVSDRTISKWENGHGIPELSLLKTVADFFEISVSELLNGERTTNREKNAERKLLEILKDNFKERKSKKIIILGASVIIIIMIFIILISFNKINELEDSEKYITYENEIYINSLGNDFTVNEVRILNFLGKTDQDIMVMSKDDKKLLLDSYYSELENFRMYGFIGGFSGGTKVNDVQIINLVQKRLTPFVLSEGEDVDEKYCLLGTTKYGTFLLGEYLDNECYVNEIVCEFANKEDSNLKVDINKYCD